MVEGGGFEPPKAEPSDLQSDPFDHSGTPPQSYRIPLKIKPTILPAGLTKCQPVTLFKLHFFLLTD